MCFGLNVFIIIFCFFYHLYVLLLFPQNYNILNTYCYDAVILMSLWIKIKWNGYYIMPLFVYKYMYVYTIFLRTYRKSPQQGSPLYKKIYLFLYLAKDFLFSVNVNWICIQFPLSIRNIHFGYSWGTKEN